MRPYLAKPITPLAEAYEFFKHLQSDDCLFHPEDDPSSIIDSDNHPLFSPREADLLRQRIAEVYVFDSDPCAYISDLK